ncbi:hypothetical protein [Cellulomonas sp. ATA003]|uniref:hypothetical protein n=1 Tax=Cellulomonas sp. ATA003 TaxID=3073064 RepID=UPI002872BCF2|nr:hypothetical protein [Cellulomonas sp. ATA003]WNB85770.1 hypothetical protein REH70_20140 [Cellulomonas sp. ATA003]
MEGGTVTATRTDTERLTRRGRPRWKVVAAGVVVALLLVVLMNELERNWVSFSVGEPYNEGYLVWTAVMAAVAAFVGARFPALGMWAGGTLACLVAAGLLLGEPNDALAAASSVLSDPVGVVRWAAHHFPIVVAAGSALAAAGASRGRPRSR